MKLLSITGEKGKRMSFGKKPERRLCAHGFYAFTSRCTQGCTVDKITFKVEKKSKNEEKK